MSEPRYIALIGDLVASRDLDVAERAPLQQRLDAALQLTHEQAGAGSVARPLITLGDEFQGLFAATEAGARGIRLALDTLQEASRPLGVRFGIGVGRLSTPLGEQTIAMDGPCFHRARAALEHARDRKLPCWLELKDPADRRHKRAIADGVEPRGDSARLWSLLACWLLHQRDAWTGPQREAVRLYRARGTWKAVAEHLGVSPGAISQRHRAADWGLAQATEATLEAALAKLAQRVEPGEDRP